MANTTLGSCTTTGAARSAQPLQLQVVISYPWQMSGFGIAARLVGSPIIHIIWDTKLSFHDARVIPYIVQPLPLPWRHAGL